MWKKASKESVQKILSKKIACVALDNQVQKKELQTTTWNEDVQGI